MTTFLIPPHSRRLAAIAAASASLLLAGCASFSPDGGLGDVARLTSARSGLDLQFSAAPQEHAAPSAAVRQLLAQPLTADSAARIALLNNPGLRVAFAELGVAEADLVQAGRLHNPGFSWSRMRGGDDVEIERAVFFDLAGLLTLPLRSGIEQRRFEQAKLATAARALDLALAARRAWVQAVAARQGEQYAQQVVDAAEAGAELGRRMARAGNWSKLDAAREQAFHAEALAQAVRARHAATAAREQLTRLLGLWGADAAFTLPERLPDLPATAQDLPDAEQRAIASRLDVQMARRDTEATAQALGLTRTTRFVNVLEAGYLNRSETGKARANGYEISLELPLFDWGGARTAKAEALYLQAVHRTADIAIRARSEVRESYSAYRHAHDLARHYRDEVVPLRKRISEEVLLRYNGMLIGVFELLADAREQVAAVNAALEAQRDFWLADTDLQAAMHGSGGTVGALGAARMQAGGAARAAHD